MERNTKIALAIGGVAAVGIASILIYEYLNGTKVPSCPEGYTLSGTDCIPNGSDPTGTGGSPCVGLGTPCSSDSDCSSCENCIGGCCGQNVPTQIIQTNDTTGLSQDVTIASIGIPVLGGPALCGGGPSFYSGQNQFTLTGQVQDASGNGVPCVTVTFNSTNGSIMMLESTTQTNNSGDFATTFQLNGPQTGGASCPSPGSTTNGSITATINVGVYGTNIITPVLAVITIYNTGV